MLKLLDQPVIQLYVCEHCGTKFTKEKTLVVHMCEQKRRYLAKDEKHVILGYTVYNRFYRLTQKQKNDKTYLEFAKSPYYNAFVKFGSFMHNVNPLYPDQYIDFVVTSGVKLDHWCREALYEKFVLHLIKTESVEIALERSIDTMSKWAVENNSVWNHYFNYISTSRAMFNIKDGKISPWLLLNCNSGRNLLNKFNDEQLAAVATMIDPPFWKKKFRDKKFDMELITQVVKESNL
jgi:hypothetical protein